MLLNGIPVEMEVYDVYTLLDLMKSEARLMEGLFSLGFKASLLNSSSFLKQFYLDLKFNVWHLYINKWWCVLVVILKNILMIDCKLN